MARKGRTDRGLMQREDVQGKVVWYVRLYHENKERRFGSFPTKTKAREFYEKAKMEQKGIVNLSQIGLICYPGPVT